jgi:hypothetical protein
MHFATLVREAQRGQIHRVVVAWNWVLLGDGLDCGDLFDVMDAGNLQVEVEHPDLVDLNTPEGRQFARALIDARRGDGSQIHPDGGKAFDRFLVETLPKLLSLAQVPDERWSGIAHDVRERAEAFAALDTAARQVVAAPFLEEAAFHHPSKFPLWDRAFAEVVVRNSRLEDIHSYVKQEWMWWFTTAATGPLAQLLGASAAQSGRSASRTLASPFAGLSDLYPRAWSCLAIVAELGAKGGQGEYEGRGHEAVLPSEDEVVHAPEVEGRAGTVVFSAIDSRLDTRAYSIMRAVDEGRLTVVVLSSLSRISRNSAKLMRMLEFYLARGASILTANLLLTPNEVYVRQGAWVRPDVSRMLAAFHRNQGLAAKHVDICRLVTRSSPQL